MCRDINCTIQLNSSSKHTLLWKICQLCKQVLIMW